MGRKVEDSTLHGLTFTEIIALRTQQLIDSVDALLAERNKGEPSGGEA